MSPLAWVGKYLQYDGRADSSHELVYECKGCDSQYDVHYYVCPGCGSFSVEPSCAFYLEAERTLTV